MCALKRRIINVTTYRKGVLQTISSRYKEKLCLRYRQLLTHVSAGSCFDMFLFFNNFYMNCKNSTMLVSRLSAVQRI